MSTSTTDLVGKRQVGLQLEPVVIERFDALAAKLASRYGVIGRSAGLRAALLRGLCELEAELTTERKEETTP